MANNEYFAAKSPTDTARIILSRANNWFTALNTNGYLDKLREMWAAYHGAYYSDFNGGHQITFGGEQGELVNLPVNHLRNLGQHILVMVTATRPAMQARATNNDYKSYVQTKLANSVLDYYMREKRLERYLKMAVEYAVVLGSGYIKVDWNATAGEIYDYDELEDGTRVPIYEGDVQFTNLSPFDVVFDSTKESQDHDWVLCRSFKNKYDLMAKYPELKDRILGLETKSDQQRFRFNSLGYDETDDIAVYEFYHRPSEALPQGRFLLFLDKDIVLSDGPMPYKRLPLYRIAPSDILGTPYGYTPLFDILPIQDAINSLNSIILSNHNAFGIQNIIMPRGSDINPTSLSGGLNVIEYNAQGGGKPEALNLTQTPPEIFNFLDRLEKSAETLSGVNSVARGNPEASLKSGAALALVQSMALQFISGLQQSYILLVEDIGTGLIEILQVMASIPRMVSIVGQDNRTEVAEFTGEKISGVNRVIVDIGNPLATTTAGRVSMAEQMLQMQLIKTPEQYFTVINTGKLDALTEDTQSELLLIKRENEDLVNNKPVIAIATERHSIHIKEHGSVLADPELKKDPGLVQRTLAHLNEHITLLRTTDPDLLMLLGEQPLGPIGGSPAGQPAPDQMMNTSQLPQAPVDQTMASPQTEAANPAASLPQVPRPPAPFENSPVNANELLPS